MRVLVDHSLPFRFAHGGLQAQIEQTLQALRVAGIEADYLRWWDEKQPADLIHFFGVPHAGYRATAAQKGLPIVSTVLFSETCNRPTWKLWLQALIIRSAVAVPGGRSLKAQLHWGAYKEVACNCVGLHAEQRILELVFGVKAEQIRQVPLGVVELMLETPLPARGSGPLICVGTITAQKNSIPLARLAHLAKTPIRFVGRPYTDNAYWREFLGLVDGKYVQLVPHIASASAMRALLDEARGALVVSEFENWSLTAHEAAARGLPLLLRPQRWAIERFGAEAHYFRSWGTSAAAATLRNFYNRAPQLVAPTLKIPSWKEVAERLKVVYQEVLERSQRLAPDRMTSS